MSRFPGPLRLSLVFAIGLLAVSCGDSGTSPDGGSPGTGDASYVVLAWNDLGMHCLNPTYDQIVILPPYNTVWAQVIERGNPPRIATAGITVEYAIENNTYSAGKRDYGQFWDSAVDLFGSLFSISDLPQDVGLTGKGLSGVMDLLGDHFVADGVPVVPVDDEDSWDPYQVALITVKDAQGEVLMTTRATVPTSDEINCGKCHGQEPFADILEEHDEEHPTNLADSKPVLCAGCHGSPALGQMEPGSSGIFLSKAIHGSHSDRAAACYDCHPGAITECSRSTRHAASDGNCVTCHGSMTTVASSIPSSRTPWVDEPVCANCHGDVDGVVTWGLLYRNAKGHGQVYCAACHGSPHAMVPSNVATDNYQAMQYQGFSDRAKAIGSCGVCHNSSRGDEDDIGEFAEKHGGANPERTTACNVCHTSVPPNTDEWPHSFEWSNSN
jgi:hypothetical protein